MFGLVGLMAILLVGLVSGAGVSMPYWKDNPAQVFAGQEGEINLNLQNMVGDTDLVFDVSYVENPGEFTSLDEGEYDVPAGVKDVPVKLSYKIPETAEVGDKYYVRINFRTRSLDVEGGIETGVGMTRMIPFVVVPEYVQESPPAEEGQGDYTLLVYLLIVLVVAGLVVYFVMRKKK